jgi:F0F1-type ATP synthase alpha subunit
MQNGFFDTIDVKQIVDASKHLEEYLKTASRGLLSSIYTGGKLTDEIEGQLKSTCEEWKRSYTA